MSGRGGRADKSRQRGYVANQVDYAALTAKNLHISTDEISRSDVGATLYPAQLMRKFTPASAEEAEIVSINDDLVNWAKDSVFNLDDLPIAPNTSDSILLPGISKTQNRTSLLLESLKDTLKSDNYTREVVERLISAPKRAKVVVSTRRERSNSLNEDAIQRLADAEEDGEEEVEEEDEFIDEQEDDDDYHDYLGGGDDDDDDDGGDDD